MSKDIKDGVSGKAFIASLDKCQTTKEVIDLLSSSMDRYSLQDRVSHLSNMFAVNHMKAAEARIKVAINPSCKFTREDMTIMAAHRYCELTDCSDKGFKEFKEKVHMKIREEIQIKKKILSANRDRYRASQNERNKAAQPARTVDNSLQM